MEAQRLENEKAVEGTENLPIPVTDPRDKELMFRGLPHGEEQQIDAGFYTMATNEVGAPSPALDIYHSIDDLTHFIGILSTEDRCPTRESLRRWMKTVQLRSNLIKVEHKCGTSKCIAKD